MRINWLTVLALTFLLALALYTSILAPHHLPTLLASSSITLAVLSLHHTLDN